MKLQITPSAVCRGSLLTAVIACRTTEPRCLNWLAVEVAGREILGAPPHYRPPVYRQPRPRPWGRTRTGSARLLWRQRLEVVADGQGGEWSGEQLFTVDLRLPDDLLPSYGGAQVQVEYEVLAEAETDAGRLRAWQPLHVWVDQEPPTRPPVSFQATAGGAARLSALVRPPVTLTVDLPGALEIDEPLTLTWRLDNPAQTPVKAVLLELVGRETCRHRAATDVQEFLVDRRRIPLAAGQTAGDYTWTFPGELAPTLRGPRFRLEWLLRAAVVRPWGLGVTGETEIVLWDRAGRSGERRS